MNLQRKHTETLKKRLVKVGGMISRKAATKAWDKATDTGGDHEPMYRLIDEYNAIKEELQERGAWAIMCVANGWSVNHDGWDLTA